MIDFSAIENIIFVTLCAAGILFSAAVICVAIKRAKCAVCKFDIAARIVCSLLFAVSIAAFVISILCDLTGSVRISILPVPTLVFGEWSYAMPLPDLVTAFSTTLGAQLILALLLTSLIALIVDCVCVGKPKHKKTAASAAPLSGEERERLEQINKIKALGNVAVKTSRNAANKNSQNSDDTSKAEKPDKKRDKKRNKKADKKAVGKSTGLAVSTDTAEPLRDYLTASSGSPEFDTFDALPETRSVTPSSETAEDKREDVNLNANRESVDNNAKDLSYNGTRLDEGAEQAPAYQNTKNDDSAIVDAKDENTIDSADSYQDTKESAQADAQLSAAIGEFDKFANTDVETEASKSETDNVNDAVPNAVIIDNVDDYAADESIDLDDKALEEYDVEPNRDIYIPKMRTVQKSAAKPVAKKKPSTAKSGVKSGAKSTGGGKKKSASKPATTQNKQSGTAAKSQSKTTQLPLTRRYAIIDRTNAVNMFSRYLKEREEDEKNKIISSINNIEIK